MNIAPSPKDTIFENGTAKLYRFRTPEGVERREGLPILLVPSMINRWYVLDLRPEASLVKALTEAGFDTWCLDWGIPNDEDRYLTWDDVIGRLGRMVRRVKRETRAPKIGVLGYCMGGTLSAIYTALEPDNVATLVSLTAPIDFSEGGLLARLVDERWFDPQALTEPGNLTPNQMQDGFVSLRPTGQISKWVLLADRFHQPGFSDGFFALEEWVGDNIPFPAEAYRTYIGELYQQNLLAKGEHYVGGQRVDLGAIDCPLLTITATRDTICPPKAATLLNEMVSSKDNEEFSVPGGHVGAVVGSKGPRILYPAIVEWLDKTLVYSQQNQRKAV
jgi:polyhydroxyalkanoate synthase